MNTSESENDEPSNDVGPSRDRRIAGDDSQFLRSPKFRQSRSSFVRTAFEDLRGKAARNLLWLPEGWRIKYNGHVNDFFQKRCSLKRSSDCPRPHDAMVSLARIKGWQLVAASLRVGSRKTLAAHDDGGDLPRSPKYAAVGHPRLLSHIDLERFAAKDATSNSLFAFRVRLAGGVGNSGVQFRSHMKDEKNFTVVGPQCEICELPSPFTWDSTK